MIRKKAYIIYLTSILTCLLSVCNFVLTSCKDDNEEGYEIVYPSEEESKPYIVTNKIGDLSYNEIEEKWIIYPENYGDETVIYMIIENMKEEYKEYQGNIKYSGTVTTQYYKIYNWETGHKIIIKSINLTAIEPITNNARSLEPPSWYFLRSSKEDVSDRNI